MEQPNQTQTLLNLLGKPAFGVKDSHILILNNEATALGITAGDPIAPLLLTDERALSDFRDGSMYLQLTVNGAILDATVLPMPGILLFLIAPEEESSVLQALSLAATQLREPLAGVMAISDNLHAKASKLTEKEKEKIGHLNRSLLHMQRLVSNMSDAPRYYNRNSCKKQTHNVTALFAGWIEKSAALLTAAGLALTFEKPGEDIIAQVSAEYLERAVLNMLSNAAEVSKPGSTLVASLKKSDKTLLFTLKDTGPGIPQDASVNMFDRYLRCASLNDGTRGLGLGMFYIRSAAAAHDGTVLLQNGKDGGLEVTLTISLKKSKEPFVRSDIIRVDYSGGYDHTLLELSNILPPELYQK